MLFNIYDFDTYLAERGGRLSFKEMFRVENYENDKLVLSSILSPLINLFKKKNRKQQQPRNTIN